MVRKGWLVRRMQIEASKLCGLCEGERDKGDKEEFKEFRKLMGCGKVLVQAKAPSRAVVKPIDVMGGCVSATKVGNGMKYAVVTIECSK